MPSTNHFKFGASGISSATRGGFKVGVSGGADYGPTSTTGFWNGVTPPVSGYTIYVDKASQGPSIHVASNDSQCIGMLLSMGATGSTIENVLAWADGQANMAVLSAELTLGDLPGVPTTYTIGQSVLGGTVGYILQSGDPGYNVNNQHGLIVWSSDVTGASFGGYGNVGAADYANWPANTAIGQGNANTTILINTNNASGTIGDTIVTFNSGNPGGYNDWFVPSTNEYTAIDSKRLDSGISNWANDWYWCSEGMDQNVGRRYYMPGGGGNYDYRFLTHPYRPIRTF
jgi:hypothetical protein